MGASDSVGGLLAAIKSPQDLLSDGGVYDGGQTQTLLLWSL